MGIRGISWGYDGNINHTNKNDMDMIWVNVSNLPTRSQCYSVCYRENHPKWPISDLRLVVLCPDNETPPGERGPPTHSSAAAPVAGARRSDREGLPAAGGWKHPHGGSSEPRQERSEVGVQSARGRRLRHDSSDGVGRESRASPSGSKPVVAESARRTLP